jgi:hypothetical protein
MFYGSTANFAQELVCYIFNFWVLMKLIFHTVCASVRVLYSTKKVQDDILRKSDQQFTLLRCRALESGILYVCCVYIIKELRVESTILIGVWCETPQKSV